MKKFIKAPFNIEKVKNGAKVVTRTGLPVRIICFDRVGSVVYPFIRRYPIIGLILSEEGNELIYTFTVDGKGDDSSFDLFLLEEVKECPTKFEPFQKVLVRVNDRCSWTATFFSHFSNNSINPYIVCNGEAFLQCIPFEGNEHLVGTNNNPE